MMIYLVIGLAIFSITGLLYSWHHTYKISFYETWLERLKAEANIPLPKCYESVKNDFWKFIK